MLYKKYKISIFIILILILSYGSYLIYMENYKKDEIPIIEQEIIEEIKQPEFTEEIKPIIKIDIKGEIEKPGVYELEEGKRVIDAISIAGGLKKNANTSAINLSKKLKDEMVIIIYTNDEIKDFTKIKEKETLIENKCNEEINNTKNDTCIIVENQPILKDTQISISTATKEELMTINGIGESKADAIIEHRTTNGDFKTIEDIKNVTGFGEALYEKIKDYIKP